MKTRHGGGGSSATTAEDKLTSPSSALAERLSNDELQHLQQIWWKHWRSGTRLPAQRGVIVLRGRAQT